MNIYISVDIEGISGVVHGDMMMPGQPEYDRGRALMIGDANAAIAGALAAGATRIVVADGHGPMRNLKIEDLHSGAELVSGTADARDACQLECADDGPFDAAFLIGYHSMAKTPKAIHPHTIAGACVHELRVNGVPHGETGLNALVLAHLGIPTVLVTGDATTCAEATRFLGPIETVAVKRAHGRNSALCRAPEMTRGEITDAATRALRGVSSSTPRYQLPEPVTIEVDFLTMAQCLRASRIKYVEQISPITIAIQAGDPWTTYQALWNALRNALYEPASFLA
ncbi:MAG TPA: M55 family metallopeptidase [Thermomicrobiales bacterium]|nr:M55 family metallopeptidase [Thermomicrobiales bacterium]